MQPIQDAKCRVDTEPEPRRTSRTKQADRFDVLFAASQTEDFCPVWIAERLSDREPVWS